MATGRQYTLSVNLRMAGQEPTKKALDSLSSGLKDVRQNAAGASTAVASSARSAAVASVSWRALGRVASFGMSSLSVAARGVGGVVKAGLILPFKAASVAAGALKGALVGLAGVAVSTWLQVKGAMAALRPAAEMEQYSIQLEVLTKSASVASRRLAQLKEYARTTNFSPKEVIEASNLMQAFGLWTEKGMRRLRAAGDAANAFGKSITEVVTAMNYLSSGRSGEAFEALSRIGVTRQALQPFGLEFKKSGELITEPKKAVDIVFAYLERQFGGMTARQSRTWKGAIQQLGGEVYNAFSEGMQKALRPMTGFVTGKIIPAVNAIGKALKQIDWQKTLAKPLAMLGGILGALRLAADPSTRATGVEQLKGIVRDVAAVGKAALNGLGGIVRGLLQDGAALLERFVTGGGVQAVFRTLYATLVSSFRFGVALFRTALDGFSDKFRSDLLSAIPGYGKEEKTRRQQADVATFRELMPQEYRKMMNDMSLSHFTSSLTGKPMQYDPSVILSNRSEYIRNRLAGMDKAARENWDAAYSRNMGWDKESKPAENYFKGVLDPLKESATDVSSRMKGLRLDATAEAVSKATEGISSAVGVLSGRIRRLDAMDSVQNRRRALQISTDAELARLARRGWDSRGRIRDNDTSQAAKAREDYARLLRTARERDVRLYAMTPQGSGVAPQSRTRLEDQQKTATAQRRGGATQSFEGSALADELRLLRRRGLDTRGRVSENDTAKTAKAKVEYMGLYRGSEIARQEMGRGNKTARSQAREKIERVEYKESKPVKAAQYVMPQIADKTRQSGKDAAKDVKQEADNMRRDAADKATVQSAVFLDEIRRTMARLATYLGQDFGMATATPGATN